MANEFTSVMSEIITYKGKKYQEKASFNFTRVYKAEDLGLRVQPGDILIRPIEPSPMPELQAGDLIELEEDGWRTVSYIEEGYLVFYSISGIQYTHLIKHLIISKIKRHGELIWERES